MFLSLAWLHSPAISAHVSQVLLSGAAARCSCAYEQREMAAARSSTKSAIVNGEPSPVRLSQHTELKVPIQKLLQLLPCRSKVH
jgi:hypothetical protein